MTDERAEACRGQLVVKSNSLVQKAHYRLTAQEQKILLYVISKIKPTDSNFTIYSFDVRDLCDVLGIARCGKNYQNIRDAVDRLEEKKFYINDGRYSGKLRWILTPGYDEVTLRVSFTFDYRLRPYLLQLREQFTSYELGNVLQMKSGHSLHIYEILKSYSNMGAVTFDLQELRDMLDLTTEHSDYRNFRRYVIDTALKEINEYTDIFVTFSPVKQGRRVTGLSFQICVKNSAEIAKQRLKREASMKGRNC